MILRVGLALVSLKAARELDWLFPCPRQEDLFTQEGEALLLPWTWDQVLYGTGLYHPNFCLGCNAKLGAAIGGKLSYSCNQCKGISTRAESDHNYGVTEAKSLHHYLEYSLGYCPELISLLICELSTYIQAQEPSEET